MKGLLGLFTVGCLHLIVFPLEIIDAEGVKERAFIAMDKPVVPYHDIPVVARILPVLMNACLNVYDTFSPYPKEAVVEGVCVDHTVTHTALLKPVGGITFKEDGCPGGVKIISRYARPAPAVQEHASCPVITNRVPCNPHLRVVPDGSDSVANHQFSRKRFFQANVYIFLVEGLIADDFTFTYCL